MAEAMPGTSSVGSGSTRQGPGAAQPHGTVPTCTVIAAFFVMVWYIPMKATLLSRS